MRIDDLVRTYGVVRFASVCSPCQSRTPAVVALIAGDRSRLPQVVFDYRGEETRMPHQEETLVKKWHDEGIRMR
jgi:hypothetical protein